MKHKKISYSIADAVAVTVKLWSDAIRGSGQDMGDFMGNMLATLAKNNMGAATYLQIKKFEEALSEALTRKIKDIGWHPANPEYGSSCRDLYMDYGPDRLLREAAKEAGMDELFLPIKSATKTCPGYVWFRFGYSARWKKMPVYSPDPAEHRKMLRDQRRQARQQRWLNPPPKRRKIPF